MHNHSKTKVILYNPCSAASGYRLPLSILQVGASIHGMVEYVFVDGNLEKNPLEKICSYLDTGEFTVFASTVMPGPQGITRNVAAYRIHYDELNPLPYEYLNTFYPLKRYFLKTFLEGWLDPDRKIHTFPPVK